MKNFKTAIY